MPTKREPLRRVARQANPAAEMAAWSSCFRYGHDFFCLASTAFNYPDPAHIPRKDIEAAWRAHGAAFMAQWEPDVRGRQLPWAFTEFGDP